MAFQLNSTVLPDSYVQDAADGGRRMVGFGGVVGITLTCHAANLLTLEADANGPASSHEGEIFEQP